MIHPYLDDEHQRENDSVIEDDKARLPGSKHGPLADYEKDLAVYCAPPFMLADADVGRKIWTRQCRVFTLKKTPSDAANAGTHPFCYDDGDSFCTVTERGKWRLDDGPEHPYDVVAFVKDKAPSAKPEFTVKDSGERAEFASGMVRDVTTGKIEWHRVADGPMLKRWAGHLTNGNVKYPDVEPGMPNWLLASGVEELQRFRESAYRHFMQWYYHDNDEDHAAAVFFNINGFEYTKQRLHDGPNIAAA